MTQSPTKVVADDYSADYFSGHVARYAQGIYDSRRQAIARHLDGLAGKRLLDMGCGIGVFSRLAAEKGARVVSSDYSWAALQYCGSQAPGCFRIRNDAERLPFKANSFDFVLAADLIEHLYAPEAFLREVQRVLRPGGKLLISTDNESFIGLYPLFRGLHCICLGLSPLQKKLDSIRAREWKSLGRSYSSFMHVSCMRLEQLLALLKKTNFTVTAWETFPFIRAPFWDDVLGWLSLAFFLRKVKADRMIVLAKRRS